MASRDPSAPRPAASRPRQPSVGPAPRGGRRTPGRPNGMPALEAELVLLRTERRPAAIARVATAREHGDLKENAEYHAAREELGFIEGRIKSLEDRHKRAAVMAAGGGR